MIVAHKIALGPNNMQETYVRNAAGTARCACHRARDQWRHSMRQGKPRRLAASTPCYQARRVFVDAGSHQKCAPNGHRAPRPRV
jgi:hypothetical protein